MPIPAIVPIVAGLASAGMGLLGNKLQQDAQRKQQQKLIDQQTEAQKQLGAYNQQLALEMWDKTNYAAQVGQLQKAGLNVGLMYKGAGEGGTTQGGAAGNSVTGGQAIAPNPGFALQQGLQTAMELAQIDNIKANTQKTLADTEKTKGVDTEQTQQIIQQLKASTANTTLQHDVITYERDIKRIEAKMLETNAPELINQLKISNERLTAETRHANAEANVSQETQQQRIKMTNQAMIEQSLRITAQKAGIQLTQEQTRKAQYEIEQITVQNEQRWKQLDQEQQRIEIQKILQEFATSDPQRIKQWVDLFTPLAGSIVQGLK